MRGRFSEARITEILREASAGTPVMDLCWNHCISRSTLRAWKAKYGAAIAINPGRQRPMENRNIPCRI